MAAGTIALNLIMRTNKFQRDMNRTHRGVNKLQRQFRTFSRTLLSVAGVSGGLYAITRGFKSIIKSASDAEEIANKFNVVFREMSGEARRWAIDFGDSVGRATQDVQNWMAGLQDTFVPLGIARDKAADLSKSLVTLAVDVASFNNKADADVIRDFTSALVGNHETVRKYGIIISETSIKQAAINRGWDKSYKELTDLEKVMLRYNLIQSGTTDAQGDAIRTAESFANQLKRLNANMTELKTLAGSQFLEPLADSLQRINRLLSENDAAIKRYISDFKEGFGVFQRHYQKMFYLNPNLWIMKSVKEIKKLQEPADLSKYGIGYITSSDFESPAVKEAKKFAQYLKTKKPMTEGAAELAAESTPEKIVERYTKSYYTLHNYFENLKYDAENWGQYTSERAVETAGNIEGSMSSAFESMIADGSNFRDAMSNFFRDVGRAFAKMAADMAARAFMANVVGSFFGSFGGAVGGQGGNAATGGGAYGGTGGGGPTGGASRSMIAPHRGGVIGQDSIPRRNIHAAAIFNAPRLHEGLRADEEIAVLQKGETVLPKGQSGQVTNVYIQAMDAQSFEQYAWQNKDIFADIAVSNMKSNHPMRRIET